MEPQTDTPGSTGATGGVGQYADLWYKIRYCMYVEAERPGGWRGIGDNRCDVHSP